MKVERKAAQEMMKNIESMSLSEVSLNSPASRAETNLILAKILNQKHSLHVTRKASTFNEVLQMSAAA